MAKKKSSGLSSGKLLFIGLGAAVIGYLLYGNREPAPLIPNVPRVQPIGLGALSFMDESVRSTAKNQLHALGYLPSATDDASFLSASRAFGRDIGLPNILPPQAITEIDSAFKRRFGAGGIFDLRVSQ